MKSKNKKENDATNNPNNIDSVISIDYNLNNTNINNISLVNQTMQNKD